MCRHVLYTDVVGNGMTKKLLIILLTTTSIATAQSRWTITEYEWRDQKNFDKYIKPDQWLNKTITFHNKSITFDFKGIQDFGTDIDYFECELLQPIDTLIVQDKKETMFLYGLDKYSACKDNQIMVIDTRPNCYKFPFRDFMVCDKVGFFELRGVFFIMTKE